MGLLSALSLFLNTSLVSFGTGQIPVQLADVQVEVYPFGGYSGGYYNYGPYCPPGYGGGGFSFYYGPGFPRYYGPCYYYGGPYYRNYYYRGGRGHRGHHGGRGHKHK